MGEELEQHIDGLRRYAMRLAEQPSDADELVQECLQRALTYSATKRCQIQDLRAYLFAILRNVRSDALSRSKRARNAVLATGEPTAYQQPAQELHLQCRELDRAIGRLPAQQREVLLLVALEGLSYRSAAQLLGIPVGTVMSRLHRSREALRQALEPRNVACES